MRGGGGFLALILMLFVCISSVLHLHGCNIWDLTLLHIYVR